MIVVIGAGAAGLMAALHAARAGAPVTVLERTADGGRKILISGGGRCNVLPSDLDERRFVTASSRGTMAKMLRAWPLGEQRAFFEQSLGIPLAVEPETGKLFPRSNRARDVRDRLVGAAREAGAGFRFGTTVTGLEPAQSGWTVRIGDGGAIPAGRVILASGGLSVPATGSDGTGLSLLERLGHRVEPTYPALTPLLLSPPVHAGLAGVSLPVRIEATFGKLRARSAGGFLFTHRGYSGPSVLDISHIPILARAAGADATIRVCWQDDAAAWLERLQARGGQTVATVLRAGLPNRLADQLQAEASVAPDRPLAQLTRAERMALVTLLTAYPLQCTGDEGYRKAEVTGGGVSLSEVEPATMESRRAPGLFLAGELLDAFGPIGGYNFVWAWATGRAAGLGAAVSWPARDGS